MYSYWELKRTRNTRDGVVLEVAWYTQDPNAERGLDEPEVTADLIDQWLLPFPDASHLTRDIIEDAVDERLKIYEDEAAKPPMDNREVEKVRGPKSIADTRQRTEARRPRRERG